MESRIDRAVALMQRFAERTGITSAQPPQRYLWTDAFAVCNLLALARHTGDARHTELARTLVGQVHAVLGRHRGDDGRVGWLSGLDDAGAADHPTAGGLRIGKKLPERTDDDAYDPRLEWDRDGQYFHYLTKWMLALDRLAAADNDGAAMRWACELARVAHHAFVVGAVDHRRMVWKRSIDLQRTLVDSMGQHDPLDGLVTCLELAHHARAHGVDAMRLLEPAIGELTHLVDRRTLATADPLGLGGLMLDAQRLACMRGASADLVTAMLVSAAAGLEVYVASDELAAPAAHRLAFRELGLVIGMGAIDRIDRVMLTVPARAACERIDQHAALAAQIEATWSDPAQQASPGWIAHEDINDVMLATALCPDGVIGVR